MNDFAGMHYSVSQQIYGQYVKQRLPNLLVVLLLHLRLSSGQIAAALHRGQKSPLLFL